MPKVADDVIYDATCLQKSPKRSGAPKGGGGLEPPLPGPADFFFFKYKKKARERVKSGPNSCLQRSSAGCRAVAQGMGARKTQASLQKLSIYSTHYYILRCCVCMSL